MGGDEGVQLAEVGEGEEDGGNVDAQVQRALAVLPEYARQRLYVVGFGFWVVLEVGLRGEGGLGRVGWERDAD